jgi:hypothetical protein
MMVLKLPGVSDADKAAAALIARPTTPTGRGSSVSFYHAKTVTTGAGSPRLFEVGELGTHKGAPAYSFIYRTTSEEIKPGTAKYQVVIKSWGPPVLTQTDIAEVDAQPYGDSYIPLINFTSSGAAKIEKWCRAYSRHQPQLACVIDGNVVSIAPLKLNAILRDNAVIEGAFEKDYVLKLRDTVETAGLRVDLLVRDKRKF